jgi:hypothetical protein
MEIFFVFFFFFQNTPKIYWTEAAENLSGRVTKRKDYGLVWFGSAAINWEEYISRIFYVPTVFPNLLYNIFAGFLLDYPQIFYKERRENTHCVFKF